MPKPLRVSSRRWLRATFDRWRSFENFGIAFPLGSFVCVCGPSGSGKSEYLSAAYASCDKTPEAWKGRNELARRSGHDSVRRPHIITPEPIGRHAGSTPATYLRVYDDIRDIYAGLPEARQRRLRRAAFSFNTPEGMCKICKGAGSTACGDQYETCPACGGKRLLPPALAVQYRGRSIAEVNAMTVADAASFFQTQPRVTRTLRCMQSLGLEYIVLGQPSNSLSGGENQRLKLVEELSKRLGDRSLYLLDNPCRGVGNGLVRAVGGALKDLIQKNNSVLVADNTMGLVALADWLVVLGPPAHTNGSLRLNIRYEGPPDEYDGDIWRL